MKLDKAKREIALLENELNSKGWEIRHLEVCLKDIPKYEEELIKRFNNAFQVCEIKLLHSTTDKILNKVFPKKQKVYNHFGGLKALHFKIDKMPVVQVALERFEIASDLIEEEIIKKQQEYNFIEEKINRLKGGQK